MTTPCSFVFFPTRRPACWHPHIQTKWNPYILWDSNMPLCKANGTWHCGLAPPGELQAFKKELSGTTGESWIKLSIMQTYPNASDNQVRQQTKLICIQETNRATGNEQCCAWYSSYIRNSWSTVCKLLNIPTELQIHERPEIACYFLYVWTQPYSPAEEYPHVSMWV